jgi:hypothetical protein
MDRTTPRNAPPHMEIRQGASIPAPPLTAGRPLVREAKPGYARRPPKSILQKLEHTQHSNQQPKSALGSRFWRPKQKKSETKHAKAQPEPTHTHPSPTTLLKGPGLVHRAKWQGGRDDVRTCAMSHATAAPRGSRWCGPAYQRLYPPGRISDSDFLLPGHS